MNIQVKLKAQEDATAEQSSCSQKLQEAVEIGKGKLAESAAYVLKLQDEQSRAKELISEYATQVRTAHATDCHGNRLLNWHAQMDAKCLLIKLLLTTHDSPVF